MSLDIDGKFAVHAIRHHPYEMREFPCREHNLWIANELDARGKQGAYVTVVRNEDLFAVLKTALHWLSPSTQKAA